MKIASIVGARPEFVQALMVSRELRKQHDEILIHTGQHYDDAMSEIFFRELGLPRPDENLGVGSAIPYEQTAHLISRIGDTFARYAPDAVIVRGDTNSTLAGAVAARQLNLPLFHIEAGMRSFDRREPEEVNRILTDHASDTHFVVDAYAEQNLKAEGIANQVIIVGDVMYDTYCWAVANLLPKHVSSLQLPTSYYLLTVHRKSNTDDRNSLSALLGALTGSPLPIVFPTHPRVRARIAEWDIKVPPSVQLYSPLSYLDMLRAERGAQAIFTDSGGVQREAYFGGIPCITLRDATEWVGTIATGWNCLAPDSTALRAQLKSPLVPPLERPQIFGNGSAASLIAAALERDDVLETIEKWARFRRAMT